MGLIRTEIVLLFGVKGGRRDHLLLLLYLTLLQRLSFGLLGADRCELNVDMFANLLLVLFLI